MRLPHDKADGAYVYSLDNIVNDVSDLPKSGIRSAASKPKRCSQRSSVGSSEHRCVRVCACGVVDSICWHRMPHMDTSIVVTWLIVQPKCTPILHDHSGAIANAESVFMHLVRD